MKQYAIIREVPRNPIKDVLRGHQPVYYELVLLKEGRDLRRRAMREWFNRNLRPLKPGKWLLVEIIDGMLCLDQDGP